MQRIILDFSRVQTRPRRYKISFLTALSSSYFLYFCPFPSFSLRLRMLRDEENISELFSSAKRKEWRKGREGKSQISGNRWRKKKRESRYFANCPVLRRATKKLRVSFGRPKTSPNPRLSYIHSSKEGNRKLQRRSFVYSFVRSFFRSLAHFVKVIERIS